MIIYESTKDQFINEILNQTLVDRLYEEYQKKLGRTKESEINSWRNSLMYMYQVLESNAIPGDSGIALEYKIPYASNRIDILITGYDNNKKKSVVIIELKQWTEVQTTEEKVGYVVTYLGKGLNLSVHPSYQAWSYMYMLENYNEAVQENEIHLKPCTFLHNYTLKEDDPLYDTRYSMYFKMAPIFAKGDILKLRQFINQYIKYGDNKACLYTIESGKISPSKALQDSLLKMLKGNKEFTLIDSQRLIYETAKYMAKQSQSDNQKRVLIVKGGPGTGKSVVAINLLVNLMNSKMNCQYVTKNEAPRNVYMEKLRGGYKQAYIKNLFKGSSSYVNAESNTFDALIVDEAHRLMANSGRFFPGSRNQIEDIINASRFSVFFIDEYQKIRVEDSGNIEDIEQYAKNYDASIKIMELESQFRCNGSDGYLSWLDDVLEIKETGNYDGFNVDYLFEIVDNPNDLKNIIYEKNSKNNKSRILAGYCWDWISSGKSKSDVHDIKISNYGFEMSWNLNNSSTWAIDENSVNEAGCIHTSQGLEFDYVGVIVGEDMRYENNVIVTDFTKRAVTDHSIKGLKGMHKVNSNKADKLADEIIKNTYRTLMTRGQKGCFVYCEDPKLGKYFKERIRAAMLNSDYWIKSGETNLLVEVD